jgi:hypothetical protein
MELRDFIVTPIVILLVCFIAYFLRPYCTDETTKKYFFPALAIKMAGAICLGLIYQFYYNGGDTYNFHTHGSRHIWEAFVDSPEKGMKFFFTDGSDVRGIYNYSSRIFFLRDPSSFFVIKVAAFFDLFTFSSYSATAVLFAVFSFIGSWMFFLTFYKQYPKAHFGIAMASFFVPSVFFWGSGVLKDTIVTGCLGIATYLFYLIFVERNFSFLKALALLLSLYPIFMIKIFVLQAYLPAVIVWIVSFNVHKIKSVLLRAILVPLAIIFIISAGYFTVLKIGEDDRKYSVINIARTAQVTAYDIRYWTGRDAGSGYSLGELDGTYQSMIVLAPQAINVSLFRPYLWEVKNPLMLISAVESLTLLLLTLFLIGSRPVYFFKLLGNPNVLFCATFSLTFAFAVGVSTFNFGTLARYKIPLLPFYAIGLVIIYNYEKSEKKLGEFEKTE